MATKKPAPKKVAKAAKSAKKAPAKSLKPSAKKAVVKNPASKPLAKKAVAKKPAPKKAAKITKPVKKVSVAKQPVKLAKPPVKATSINKKAAAPLKKAAPVKPAVIKKPEPAKKIEPVKKADLAKKAEPVKNIEPVKKPVVSAPTHQQVKPIIKPIEKPVAKKEPPKPVKVVIPKTSTTRSVRYTPDFTKSVLDSYKHENTGPTMRYSDGELVEFKELILKKLDTAKKELNYLQGLITRKDEGGDMEDGRYMTMEDGSMSMEREQLSQMASRQIQFIDHLEKALMRIENKTYGICRVTGKLIDKARLRAVPHATLSMEAKQTMTK